ncbi:hypothetical protein T484DRAFT_3644129 [Baffinella frigidus]|nr:hypothetical protein T484DRAFT_3644129 [Cryptophyta sp. CCMP2293]
MFTYGFVPWHFRSIRSGDQVPEVLPAGSITWSIIQGNAANECCDYGDDASKTLLYDVSLSNTSSGVKRKDVFIYETTNPSWNITQGSSVSSTYPSPLATLIPDYKNLRTALQNRAYADEWNSHAHIITKQQSQTNHQDPSSNFLEAGMSATDPIYTYEKAQLQLHSRDDDIQKMFNKKATAHMPYVYTLPMDVSLEQTLELKPCVDIPFLDARFKNDIASLTGIPSELLAQRGVSKESSARTRTSTHQFHSAMDSIAQQLQLLLADVYRRAYHNTDHRPRGQSWSTALSKTHSTREYIRSSLRKRDTMSEYPDTETASETEPGVKMVPPVNMVQPIDLAMDPEDYTTQELDGNETDIVERKPLVDLNNKMMKKKKVANIFDGRTDAGRNRWVKFVTMIKTQENNVVIKDLLLCMKPNLGQNKYTTYINRIKEQGSPDMEVFAKTYMGTTGSLSARNRNQMRCVIDRQMTERNLWPPTNPRR